jgi:hypothetical protein
LFLVWESLFVVMEPLDVVMEPLDVVMEPLDEVREAFSWLRKDCLLSRKHFSQDMVEEVTLSRPNMVVDQ